jgi:hypothetical protein
MDETAVYRVALSAKQVAKHYRLATSSHAAPEPPPAANTSGPSTPAAPVIPPPRCTLFAGSHGSASASGASKDAPTTLTSAASRAAPGSIVCLEAGTYNVSSNLMLKRSGTRSAPITFRNYVGVALLQYTGGATTGGILQVLGGSSWGGAHDIVFDGLTMDGGNAIGSGVFVARGAHHVVVRNCSIRNTGSAGIVFNANDYVTAEHNLISHVGYVQGSSSGISLWNGGPNPTYGGSTAWYDTGPGFHNFIVGNIISGAYDATDHTDGNGIVVDGSGSIPPALIADNLTYENGGRGIVDFHNSGDVWVINNTAYANGLDLRVGEGRAPDLMANEANAHFVNNIGYGRINGSTFTDAYTYNNTQSTIAWSDNLAFNGTTSGVSSSVTADPAQYRYADPLFTAAPPVPGGSAPWAAAVAPWGIADGLTTQPGSPAIDTGVDPHTVAGMTSTLAAGLDAHMATDLAGAPRTQGAATDLGAYER